MCAGASAGGWHHAETRSAAGPDHGGGFVGGIAVGALLVGLFVIWSDYFYERGRGAARSLPGDSLLKGEDRVE